MSENEANLLLIFIASRAASAWSSTKVCLHLTLFSCDALFKECCPYHVSRLLFSLSLSLRTERHLWK